VHDFRQSAIELPIFLQSALIILVRKIRDAVRMMRYQITKFWNSAAQFFLCSIGAGIGDPGFISARRWPGSLLLRHSSTTIPEHLVVVGAFLLTL
jgi:hypothetical protein